MHPDKTPMNDPMNHKPHKKKCPYCETVCQVVAGSQDHPIVETKRFLGKIESAEDPVWKAQCMVQGET